MGKQGIATKKLTNDTIPRLRSELEEVYGVWIAEVALNYIFDPEDYFGDEMLDKF